VCRGASKADRLAPTRQLSPAVAPLCAAAPYPWRRSDPSKDGAAEVRVRVCVGEVLSCARVIFETRGGAKREWGSALEREGRREYSALDNDRVAVAGERDASVDHCAESARSNTKKQRKPADKSGNRRTGVVEQGTDTTHEQTGRRRERWPQPPSGCRGICCRVCSSPRSRSTGNGF
jgi:hypothetical protein